MWSVAIGSTGGVGASIVAQVLTVANAAAQYWFRYVDDGLASIDIRIDLVALPDGSLAQGGTDFYFDHAGGGFNYLAPSTVTELLTGVDGNGGVPDIQIEVDSLTLNAGQFSFGPLVDGVSVGGGGYDLWTVLVHEIGHALGFISIIDQPGTDRTTFDERLFQNAGGAYYFEGPTAGQIYLFDDLSHLAVASILQPTLDPGQRFLLTPLELAMFADIGVPFFAPTSGNDRLSSVSGSAFGGGGGVDGLAGDDTILGLPGDDGLVGNTGDDSLMGSLGADELIGGAGADTLSGGGDNDLLAGGEGGDSIDGGAGSDTVDFQNSSGPVSIVLGGLSSGGDAEGDTISNVEGVIGTFFADTLVGDASANYLSGVGGADLLIGGGGRDTLVGGALGTMVGGAGADLFVNAGFVSYANSPAAISIDMQLAQFYGGHAQGDIIEFFLTESLIEIAGSSFADTIFGSDYDADELFGLAGDDSLGGRDGADTLTGGEGADFIDGGADVDTADYGDATGAVLVDLALGLGQGDTLVAVENISGSASDDTLIGDGGGNYLSGGAGLDSLIGGAGNDRFASEAGADTMDGGLGSDVIDYSAETTPINLSLASGVGVGGDSFVSIENIVGTSGDDSITGDASANRLNGGSGAGGDTLLGGAGNDTLIADTTGFDLLDGGDGADTVDYSSVAAYFVIRLADGYNSLNGVLVSIENIIGSVGAGDWIEGDSAANKFLGLHANDTLIGGDGADTLDGGKGADSLAGGAGVDEASYASANRGVSADLAAGTAKDDKGASDTLVGIENVTGSQFNDTLIGDAAANGLSGGIGADSLSGGDGADALDGGAENDALSGGKGFDNLQGGSGGDSMHGGAVADTLLGGDGDDSLNGATGNDSLVGAAGYDSLYGKNGADALDGGKKDDLLIGGAGVDTLIGGDGNDILSGNGGADTFVLSIGGDQDTVRDFATGAGDVILLVCFGAVFDTFTEVLAAATDNGADTTIDFGGGDMLLLKGVVVADLNADDFTFG